MYETSYAIGLIVGYVLWAGLSYFVANKAVEKNPGINVNPVLYAVGSLAFGALWVMAFLGCKVLWFRNKQKQKLEAASVKDEELELLKQRLSELENKKEDQE